MRPGEAGTILRLDARPEFHAVHEGLAMIEGDTFSLGQVLFYGFNETDYSRGFNPVAGEYKSKPRTDDNAGFDITRENVEIVRRACEATLAANGFTGAMLRIRRAKSAAEAILAATS